jgi:tetratricopeptide (TPR) repeat protein
LGAWLVSRRGRAGIVGFGILWFWLSYLIEFSVARFQEPFVLYRSYLWAPGIAVALAVLAERLSPRIVVAAGVVLASGLAWQAHDRLRTFSSGLALWEDAAAKLPPHAIPGGSRALYQLGREYFYGGRTADAERVVDRCMTTYPGMHRCVFARAAMAVSEERFEDALPYLKLAIAERPRDGVTRHHLGVALQGLGCREQAKEQYELSVKLGFWGGVERLKSLEGKGGVLPAAHIREPAKPYPCAEALKGIADPGR